MSHRVDKQFRALFQFGTIFVVVVVIFLVCIDVCDRVIVATVFVSRIILSILRLIFLPF